jgi:hypothetical protein
MLIDRKNWQVKLEKIGYRENVVLLIDNFFSNPEDVLREYENSRLEKVESGGYPGSRIDTSQNLKEQLQKNISPLIREYFCIDPIKYEVMFSRVTKHESELKVRQRIPHTDSLNENDSAFIIYLFRDKLGGTSFYRHSSTGYENMNAKNNFFYEKNLSREFQLYGLPEAKYINGNSKQFERIHSVDGIFNRFVLYKQNLFHSGNIIDPEAERITITGFVSGLPSLYLRV